MLYTKKLAISDCKDTQELIRPDTDQRYLTHVTITYVRTYTPCTMERDYAWRLATWVVNAFRVSSLPVLQGQEIPFRLNFYLFFYYN